MTLKQMIDHQIYLDRKKEILYRRHAEAAAEAAAHEYELHQRMEAEGFEVGDDVKHQGTRWGRQFDWYATIQDPFEFATWAEENAPHLVKPKPDKKQLNELVRQAQEDGTPLPPGIGASPRPWVSRRAA